MSTASVSSSSSISDKAVNTSAEHNRFSNVEMAAHIMNAIWNCLLPINDVILCVCVCMWEIVLFLCEIDKIQRLISCVDSLRISHGCMKVNWLQWNFEVKQQQLKTKKHRYESSDETIGLWLADLTIGRFRKELIVTNGAWGFCFPSFSSSSSTTIRFNRNRLESFEIDWWVLGKCNWVYGYN